MLRIKVRLPNGIDYNDKIYGDPIVVGGEGRIYRYYHSKLGDCRIKLYHSINKAAKRKDKIYFLIKNRFPTIHPKIQYCWPLAAVYDEFGINFLGFIMEATPNNSRDLTILSNHIIGRTIKQEFPREYKWYENDKYELNSLIGIKNRITLLINWAVAIRAIHNKGIYCLADIKPENVFITPDGSISIIDIDSMQIHTNDIFYKASAVTPEYFPREAYIQKSSGQPLMSSCDSFAFGCCAYMVLTGTHPYNNIILKPPYNTLEYSTIASCIKADLYIRGNKANYISKVSKDYDLQSNFDKLPYSIRLVLNKSLGKADNRPTFDEWVKFLKQGKDEL